MISRSTAWIATGALGAASIVGVAAVSLASPPDQQTQEGPPVVIDTTSAPAAESGADPDATAPVATTPGATPAPTPSPPADEADGGGSVIPDSLDGGADQPVQQVPAPPPAPYNPGGDGVDSPASAASAPSADSGD